MAKKCPKCQSDNPGTATFCADCGTQLPSLEDIEVTETIEVPKEELTTGSTFAGRYKIIEELGRGGMGNVYKVLDKEVNAKVALKLIKPEIAADKKTIERFRNELKVARDIAHKNVCRMYHLGKEEGAYYITMEYVSGEDLKSFIRRSGIISIGKAISIANQVCEGLSEAHRLGVIHRDLKPQNIMIDKEGNARIMDFGIARSLRAKGITGSGVMIGTPEYMSPEQVDGKEADLRADIYSLGVILYEMVTGRVPFEGDTPFSIGVKQKSEVPRPPREINEQIPEVLNQVILKCMEKDKEKRFQSIGELNSELLTLEKGIPTTERIVPEKKPLTSREISVQFSLKKLLIPAFAVIAIVIIGLILWLILPRKKTTPFAPTGKPSLAVMYFQNNTGDQSLDIWRDGLSRMLIADLSQSKYIRIISDDQLYGILNQLDLLAADNYSTEDLKEVASKGGATHILRGILTKSGDSFRINTTLQESNTMEIIGSEMVEGKGEGSLHTMVDELTRRIKKNLELTPQEIAQDTDREIGEITTSSPEAYKYYSEGRIRHMSDDYEGSIALMEKAIEIDPEFAMAYRSLGASYINLGNLSKERENIQKAFELSDRVSEREQYLILGNYYSLSEKTYDKAIEAYENLLEKFPGDNVWHMSLGIIYDELEEWDKAIEHYELSKQENVDPFLTYYNLAGTYAYRGRYDKAREVLQEYLENVSESTTLRFWLGYTYLWEGRYEEALQEAEKLFKSDPTSFNHFVLKGDIQVMKGNFAEAKILYQNPLDDERPLARLYGLSRSAYLSLLQGKFKEAETGLKQSLELAENIGREGWGWNLHLNLVYIYLNTGRAGLALQECERLLEKAIEKDDLYHQRLALLFKGLSHLGMSSIEKAQKMAADLKALVEEGMNKKAMRYYFLLMGRIELEQGNFAKSAEYLGDAVSLMSAPFSEILYYAIFFDSLARALFDAGNLEAALKEYEKISSLNDGRFYKGDIFAKSFYMLGKIYEEQGETAKAIENHEKFLSLWKDADPGIAEVEDARKRLAKLKDI